MFPIALLFLCIQNNSIEIALWQNTYLSCRVVGRSGNPVGRSSNPMFAKEKGFCSFTFMLKSVGGGTPWFRRLCPVYVTNDSCQHVNPRQRTPPSVWSTTINGSNAAPHQSIPSTLNIDYLLWHTQLIVCGVKY